MRSTTLALIASSAVLLFSSGCGDGPTQPTTVTPGNTGVIGSQQARFVFPPASQSTWQWNQDATSANANEYAWSVALQNGDTTYEVGYFIFKFPGASPGSGDLASLLRVGQCSVFETQGGTATMVRWAAVKCVAEGQQVVVIVDDPQTLQLLVSARPRWATFKVKRPGQANTSTDVELQYQ